MKTNRQSNVMIKELDFSGLEAEMMSEIQASEKRKVMKVNFGRKMGYAEKNGDIWVLDEDGCGNKLAANGFIEVAVYGEYLQEDGKTAHDFMPARKRIVNKDDISSFPTKEVNLADFIRTFGSRLESNFMEWKKILENNA